MKIRKLVKSSLAILVSTFSLSAQSTVIYNFISAPLIASTTDVISGQVTTYPPAASIAGYGARLSFAAPLAASTTTTISAEIGGQDNIGTPSAGGVLDFSASADVFSAGIFTRILTSNPNDYFTTSLGDELHLFRYSEVGGTVTTDAAGNISDWNLSFILWESFAVICTGPNCVPKVNLGSLDLALTITSGAAVPASFNYSELNGVPGNGTHNFLAVDAAFADPGNRQVRSYSGAPGTWSVSGSSLPIPGTLTLILISALAMAGVRRR